MLRVESGFQHGDKVPVSLWGTHDYNTSITYIKLKCAISKCNSNQMIEGTLSSEVRFRPSQEGRI